MNTTSFNFDVCPCCLGTGKLKAKRKAKQFNGPPIDYDEVLVACMYCNGTGTKSSTISAPRSRRIE